jgi:acyl-CoA thioesterase
MEHPFADLIGLKVIEQEEGHSKCSLKVINTLCNPHKVAHGAVIFSLADTGMGAALYSSLREGELCATIEIKIAYYKPVFEGELVCNTEVVHKGSSIATLKSRIFCKSAFSEGAEGESILVASAEGNYSIFKPRSKP